MNTLPALFAAAMLHAGVASVVDVRGAVRITGTTATAARAAHAGDEIGEKDLVLVPESGAVTLRLADGTETRVEGKAIVAGRRLRSRNAAAFHAIAARSVGLVSHEIETAGSTTAMAIRGDEAEAPELGDAVRAPRGMTFLGEGGETRRSSDAEFAERSLREADFAEAERLAIRSLADREAMHEERRRANRVLAFIAMRAGDASTAVLHFDRAIADTTAADGRPVLDALHVERARSRLLLADDEGAESDLRLALEAGGDPPRRMEAHFLLGILAVGKGDKRAAKMHFAVLENVPALEAAAAEALTAMPRSP